MKKSSFLILMLGLFSFFLIGCQEASDNSSSSTSSSTDNSSTSQQTEGGGNLNFQFTMNAFQKQALSAKVGRFSVAKELITGQLSVKNTGTSEAAVVHNWSIYLDQDQSWDAQSNKTIILTPGNYDFSLVLSKDQQQYSGTVNASIVDGTNDVAMTIRPVIGDTQVDVNVVANLADFKFRYSSGELSQLADPKLGVIVNDGTEDIFDLNSGDTDRYLSLDSGVQNLKLKLYDGNTQVGKSITAQEGISVTPGQSFIMNLVPLYGETTFSLTEEGGDAAFHFTIPSDVIDEAGGLANLRSIFSISGFQNPLRQEVLSIDASPDASGDYHASLTLTQYQYDTVSTSLVFEDIANDNEILASCAQSNVVIDQTTRSLTCDIELRRRAIIDGNIQGVLGVNVYAGSGAPAQGVTVSIYDGTQDVSLGLTGNGSFGTAGYFKGYLKAGVYTIRAKDAAFNFYGEKSVTITPLGISNIELDLIQEFSFLSCKDALAQGVSTGSGEYQIDPDGNGGEAPFSVYCDMTKDGGGWTYLVYHVGQGGTNAFWSNSPAYYSQVGFSLGNFNDMNNDFLSKGFSSMSAGEVMIVRQANQAYATRVLDSATTGKNLLELMTSTAVIPYPETVSLNFGSVVHGTQAQIQFGLAPTEMQRMFGVPHRGYINFMAYNRNGFADPWHVQFGPILAIEDGVGSQSCGSTGWSFGVTHPNGITDVCRAHSAGDAVMLAIR